DPRLATEAEPRLRHWAYEFKEHNNIFCVVYGPDGKVLVKTEELAELSIPPAPAVETDRVRYEEAVVPALGRQREVVGRLRLGEGDYTVVLRASLADVDRERGEVERERAEVSREKAEVDREMGRFLVLLIVGVGIALAMSGGLGYFLARKALVPV